MELSQKILTKIFIGCHITSEMRMHLNKSIGWKQISFMPIKIKEIEIQEIHFQGKEYFGCYISEKTVSISQLYEFKSSIQTILHQHCPGYPVEHLKVYVLPQLLIA